MPFCDTITEKMLARHILCFMLFTGFMATFLLRININLAIVAMVKSPGDVSNITEKASHNSSTPLLQRPTLEADDGYDWSEFEQSVILSSFFWGYLCFQVPGGRVAEIWGTKKVFGTSILVNGLLCLLIPAAAGLHWSLLLCIRALQGLAQGVVFPCLSAAVARWVPPPERASFISFAIQGASLGTVIALPLCGWIIGSWGWPAVFYVSGVIAVLWYAAWAILIYDTPDQHPRISEKEKQFLQQSLEQRRVETLAIPWRSVVTSLQFWVGVSAAIGNDWGFHMFCNFGPKYMKNALGFDLEQSSLLSSLPFLSQYVFSMAYAALCDYLLHRQVATMTVRKMSVTVSHVVPAFGMAALAASTSAHDVTLSITILTLSVSAIGAISCGFFQNPLDIAPNFAGSLTGVTNAIGALTAVVSTPLTGYILQSMGTISGWQLVFSITAGVYIVTSLPYLFLATGQLQPWNDPKTTRHTHRTYPLDNVDDPMEEKALNPPLCHISSI